MRSAYKIGVLYSGGLDSSALIGQLLKKGYEIWPVNIRCGLPWEKKESAWASKFLQAIPHKNLHAMSTVRLLLEEAYSKNWSQLGKTPGSRSDDSAVFLPARNLLLIVKAMLFLFSKKVNTIALATLRGNPFPDATPNYFRSLEKILTQSFQTKIKIRTPFRNLKKSQVIKSGKALPLHLSLSCINPTKLFHCGRCNKCAERRQAFKEANVVDKTIYIKAGRSE